MMDKHFVLLNDIDLNPNLPGGQVFDRALIGDGYANPFEGTFDGNGHNIHNLHIDGNFRIGLIGAVGSEGHVRDLGLLSVRISGNDVGPLAGRNRGLIQNCYASGTVTGHSDSGGIVGENEGSVTGCHSTCDVTGNWRVGGLVGDSSRGSISLSHATGAVTGDNEVGGLLGDVRNTVVSRCYATGAVTGNREVGGLIGQASNAAVAYCYAMGSVEGENDVGGLVGHLWSASVGWCYSTGSVAGVDRVGGLIGHSIEAVYSSFFLSPEAGGGSDNGYGIGLTLAEMSRESSFSGWDFYGANEEGFDAHWFMPPGGPPVLVWQSEITGLVAVPATAALPWSEAESALVDAGFVIGTVNYGYDRTVPADHVVLVRPAAYAPPGSTLDVVLSNGNYNWQDNPGSGSPEEPYRITSPGQLESLGNNPNLWDKHFILANDINLDGRTYQATLIAGDLDSNELSAEAGSFSGSFDGNGFTISHLTIMPEAPVEFGYVRSDLGLFGKIGHEGEISNLRLVDVQVTTYQAGTRFRGTMGALAVENEGTISHCSVDGSIVGSPGNDKVGALVGINRGKIESSYAGPGTVAGRSTVGGLVGLNEEGTAENCYSVMSVEGDSRVGGLIGQNHRGTVIASYAAGSVKARRSNSHGGLIGNSWPDEGFVADCFWDIDSTGQVRGGGGMGLTTSEMMDASVYALNGWAGNTAWTIDDGEDYPRLAWEGRPGANIPQPPVVDWLEGAGTADDPYVITTTEQLGRIATATVILDKYFVLAADLDLADVEWRPIGISTGTRFTGVFDGKDHTISNLTVGTPEGLMYPGMSLFGYTGEQATISNVVLANATVLGGHNGEWTGGLVGDNLAKLKDCHVEASLTGSNCGGLAGRNGGLLLYCTSTCTISDERGLRWVGGLVGENEGGSIFACRATGSITCGAESEDIGGAVGSNYWRAAVVACSADVAVTCGDKSERVGGLVGFNWSTVVTDSYSSGPVAVGQQSEHVGGLIGETWSNVVNCYAFGAVTGQQVVGAGGLLGGIGTTGTVTAGYFLSPADGGGPDNGIGTALTDQQMRQRSSFEGWDFGPEPEDGVADFWSIPDDVGYPALTLLDGYQPPAIAGAGTADDPYLVDSAGHIGFAARNPDASYRLVADLDLAEIVPNTAVVPILYGGFDGNGQTIRNLTIAGGRYMGLFGMISPQAFVQDLGVFDAGVTGSDTSEYVAVLAGLNRGTIARCAVTGTVAGGERVGGLAGENRGQIADCYSTCNVTANSRGGGLVGENSGSITTSYVNGEVFGQADQWGIGAFVGYSDGSLVNCLWEKREGLVTTTDVCLDLTTEQMKHAEFLGLNGWAENPSWVIHSGNDYPRLVWEKTVGKSIPVPTIDWLAGTGTPETPYEISTPDQFALLGAASILWDSHFVLTADLDCTGVQFKRIGACPGTGFRGHFDGAYHEVVNLSIGSDAPGHRYLGLFGYMAPDGSVSRLIMENVNVVCGLLAWEVAALAGYNDGRIGDCGVSCSLDCGDKYWAVGGLAGGNNGIIERCRADIAISAGDEGETIGGLIGSNYSSVTNSYASGSVHTGLSVRRIGGLVGSSWSGGPLVNCYASGEVTRKSAPPAAYPEMGGLVGYAPSSGSILESCYYLGRNNNLGIQLSDEQMKKQASFVGWDFVGETANGTADTWRILEGQDYPRLQWELKDVNEQS
jgi:hypothetical protein